MKIRVKMAPNVVCLSKHGAQPVCRQTYEDVFLEVTPQKGLHDLYGRKFVAQKLIVQV